jgi:hypothetical protein
MTIKERTGYWKFKEEVKAKNIRAGRHFTRPLNRASRD